MKSWKTTLCGVLGAIAAAITLVALPLLDQDEATNPNWAGMTAALATAAGLFFAKDHQDNKPTVTPETHLSPKPQPPPELPALPPLHDQGEPLDLDETPPLVDG